MQNEIEYLGAESFHNSHIICIYMSLNKDK